MNNYEHERAEDIRDRHERHDLLGNRRDPLKTAEDDDAGSHHEDQADAEGHDLDAARDRHGLRDVAEERRLDVQRDLVDLP